MRTSERGSGLKERGGKRRTASTVEPVKFECETWPSCAWNVESGIELTCVIASFPPRTYVRLFSLGIAGSCQRLWRWSGVLVLTR